MSVAKFPARGLPDGDRLEGVGRGGRQVTKRQVEAMLESNLTSHYIECIKYCDVLPTPAFCLIAYWQLCLLTNDSEQHERCLVSDECRRLLYAGAFWYKSALNLAI